MLKLYTLLFSSILCLSYFSQVDYKIVSQNDNNIIIDISFKGKDFKYKTINNNDYIDFSSIYKIISLEKGAPALPFFGSSYRIPSKGKISIEIIDSETETFNVYGVLPSKGNLKRNVNPSNISYEFLSQYQKDEFYPQNIIKYDNPNIFRTVRLQNLLFYPYQYNPISNTIKLNKKIRVKINIDKSQKGIDEVEKDINLSDVKTISNLLKNESFNKYTTVEEDGEMLVICPEIYQNILIDLVNWKNQKGIKTVLKTTEDTGQSESEITSFLDTYYDENPNFKYLILVGDYSDIPTHSYGTNFGEQLYSDSYYGQLVGSGYYPDIFVGRLSGDETDIQTMVNRILEYEKNPLLGNWTKKAIGLASGEGAGYGDEGEADWQHMRGLRDIMLDFGYQQIYEFYDGNRSGDDANGSPTQNDLINALNDGVSLFNYTGHGDVNTFVTSEFSSNNINQTSNNGKYPFVVSVACNHGTFVNANCISETWLNAKTVNGPTGAIAACGSSILMAWAPPMETQDELTLINTKNIQNNYKTTLGGLFYNAQMGMLESYGQDGVEVMQTWIFFGDPSVVLRNDSTKILTASHIQNIPANQINDILINCDVDNADVALSVNKQLIEKSNINVNYCSIQMPSYPDGTIIDVVVSKQNYVPYIGQIVVGNSSSINEFSENTISVYPNPIQNELNIVQNSDNSQLFIYNIDGQLIKQVHINSSYTKVNMSELSNGIYYIKIKEIDKEKTYKIVKN